MGLTLVYDAIAGNIDHLPPHHQYAGYSTGDSDIEWSTAQFAAHPGTLRICQDAGATDTTADYLDVERFAATNTEAANWYRSALSNYTTAKRPGQRFPAIYTSMSNVTPLVNQMIADGVTAGPRLIVANWSLDEQQAIDDVVAASGPFPIVGVQFASGQFFDLNIMSSEWIGKVSVSVPALFRHLSGPGDTFIKISDERDANLTNLIKRSVAAYDSEDFIMLGRAALVTGTPYYTANP